ncbi:MAG: phosphotransferase [Rubrivivax sp.]|nr:phosphotransferase [Rubrivivax sp.]
MASTLAATQAQVLPAEFVQALRELHLLAPGEVPAGVPLAGGVSSDIWRIDTAGGPLAAKRALPQLRVAADWRAPIERNAFEARWMRVAGQAVPGCAPRVLGQHAALGVLVMEWLPVGGESEAAAGGAGWRLWKDELRHGRADAATARAVGRTLVRIHAHSAARAAELAPQFDTDRIFFEIRLAPYLLATAQKHAGLAPALRALVEQTRSHKRALVHGDVSPKNILVQRRAPTTPSAATTATTPAAPTPPTAAAMHERPSRGPVLLDAECAWWGDPAFDLAFCLNHLLLKALWVPAARAAFAACFDALAAGYLAGVDWEDATQLERRAAALLPGLLLARVDGKSPVEYLTEPAQRDTVRRAAQPLLLNARPTLAEVQAAWQRELEEADRR